MQLGISKIYKKLIHTLITDTNAKHYTAFRQQVRHNLDAYEKWIFLGCPPDFH